MRAITVIPGQPGSVSLEDMPEPLAAEGAMLVEILSIGVCGTDIEIISGEYGTAPPDATRLIIGHESLGRVVDCPPDCGFSPGDLVVGIVRRPDPVPCRYCATGEWDMCRNGQFTERGIKARHGYASERVRLEPEFAVRVDAHLRRTGVLLEPTSVVAKAWEHTARIGQRSPAWRPQTALVTGAGPIGLLAALIGTQRGLDVHVFDRVSEGLKPDVVQSLGATYHSGDLGALAELRPDIVMECTGAPPVIIDAITRTGASGIVCLTGVSSGGRSMPLDIGDVNRRIVLENDVVFGSVNANRRHYQAAADALAAADQQWLERLITRRVPISEWHEAFARRDNDVKVVIEFEHAD